MQQLTFLTLLIISFFVSANLHAEQKIEDEHYVVHYSAINTTRLTPEVAKLSGITRSKNRAMLNIAVQKKKKDGSFIGVVAQLQGTVTNLIGQQRNLDFSLVTEGSAVYYLAEFFIDDGEKLYFKINAQPVPNYNGLTVSFNQTFYKD